MLWITETQEESLLDDPIPDFIGESVTDSDDDLPF